MVIDDHTPNTAISGSPIFLINSNKINTLEIRESPCQNLSVKNVASESFMKIKILLDMMVKIHNEFCRKVEGQSHSFMHREDGHDEPMDSERANDEKDVPIRSYTQRMM